MKTNLNKYLSKLSLVLGISAVALTMPSCNKFLDVNENPNNPSSTESKFILPTGQIGLATVVGNSFQIYGGIWGQYWTQSPSASQYRTMEQYRQTNTAFDRPWTLLYRSTFQNCEDIIDKGTSASNAQYAAIAYLVKAYGLQVATDAFGDVPCSTSNDGLVYTNPTYDPQKQVYDSIISYIEKGIALINSQSDYLPGDEDLVFNGDMDSWHAFANTLKLKVYLRLLNVEPSVAQAGIKALSGATFLTQDAKIDFISAGGNQNPLYSEIVGLGYTQNLVASGTAVTNFLANNDPRVNVLYDKVKNKDGTVQDTIAYIEQGAYAANATKQVSPPSALVGASAQNQNSALAPVKFISAAESYFLQSEAVARGFISGDAKALYQSGISASFVADGLTTADAGSYMNAGSKDVVFGSTLTDNVKAIITQKYYAMCGMQNFEAWTEWRRTGYPSFFVKSAASGSITTMPQRMLYSNAEMTSNINFPGNVSLFTPVWWQGK
ncbi:MULTISPECIES: SusD/RagB family nutrient-binding outer membrane lipoprotein [Chitinophagaceae]